MAEIRPFRAMMFHTPKAGNWADLCCPPYDIIPDAQRKALYELPNNSIQLELSPGEGAQRYVNAHNTLEKWLDESVLKLCDQNAIYVYEEEFTVPGTDVTKIIRGMIVRVKLEEFSKGVVLPHEETLSKAKQDRFDLMCATGCNFSQVYSMYIDDERRITPKMDQMAERKPDVEFTYSDGVTHRLWIETNSERISALCAEFAGKQLFIADGHHRYETAIRYRDTLRQENGTAGNAEYVMMMLVDIDHPGIVVLPTHRLLFDLPQFSVENTLEQLRDRFEISEIQKDTIEETLAAHADIPSFVLTAENRCYLLQLRSLEYTKDFMPDHCDAYRGLDVAVLHSMILEPLFGIDKENMANQKNLRYTRSTAEAVSEVENHSAQAAFILNSTRVRQIKDVALAGEKMPQKSTYFYPKILTGLVFNNFTV